MSKVHINAKILPLKIWIPIHHILFVVAQETMLVKANTLTIYHSILKAL